MADGGGGAVAAQVRRDPFRQTHEKPAPQITAKPPLTTLSRTAHQPVELVDRVVLHPPQRSRHLLDALDHI